MCSREGCVHGGRALARGRGVYVGAGHELEGGAVTDIWSVALLPAEAARCSGTVPPPPTCLALVRNDPHSGVLTHVVCHVTPSRLPQTLCSFCSPPTLWAWPLLAPSTTSSTSGTTTHCLSLYGQQTYPPSSSEAQTLSALSLPYTHHITPSPPPPLPSLPEWLCRWWWSGVGTPTPPRPQAPPPSTLST